MTQAPARRTSASSTKGLLSVFGSTLFQLSGVFMLSPLMLVLLKEREVSTTVAGLFAATTWLGILSSPHLPLRSPNAGASAPPCGLRRPRR